MRRSANEEPVQSREVTEAPAGGRSALDVAAHKARQALRELNGRKLWCSSCAAYSPATHNGVRSAGTADGTCDTWNAYVWMDDSCRKHSERVLK